MKQLTSQAIRELWLNFWTTKAHTIINSVSLVPINDPTLLWINSGVAGLKEIFSGKIKPISTRLCNIQKSVRTGDIENVGNNSRHLTFFEMLGNFSIGDYFKKEAIQWAWEFLTHETYLAIDKTRLYVTVFEEDTIAHDIWTTDTDLDPTHLFKLDKKTNFWDMGNGPCGPNTEIFYDRGEDFDPSRGGISLLTQDLENDRYIEIWNIVFSQFYNTDQVYTPMQKQNIDTGAGFERLVCLSQRCTTIFETDLFINVINHISTLTNHDYHAADFATQKLFKIIADHMRTVVMTISDGVMPDSKQRGYIIRKLIRKMMICGWKLNLPRDFLEALVDKTIAPMAEFYDIKHHRKLIKSVITLEAVNFWKLMDRGDELIHKLVQKKLLISGPDIFKLTDSFGLPIDIIEVLAHKYQATLDKDGFERCLQHQKQTSQTDYKNKKYQIF